jgi:hypothetical protein
VVKNLELGKAYESAAHERKVSFSAEVREKLLGAVPIAITALIELASNKQTAPAARCAAARQLVRMAYVAGVLEKDTIKDFLSDFGKEIDQLEIS